MPSNTSEPERLIKKTKQNYFRIKSNCKESKKLFEDDLFKADKSLLPKKYAYDSIEWRRPHEISQEPKLFYGNARAADVIQGELGNCWFVAAASVLATERNIWNNVIPHYKLQEFDYDYSGIFRFKFWKFGKWVEIVIDDRLPCRYGSLLFTRSSNKNEFWSALLEKAYAKLHGTYDKLDGGTLSEALQDFTGGICESISLNSLKNKNNKESTEILKHKQDDLFFMMKKSIERKSLMACAIAAKNSTEMEKKLSCGLVIGHAYAITKIQLLVIKENAFFKFLATTKETLHMIRLNNPWGQNEWNGPWSDNSNEWKRVPKTERDKMGLTFDDDGEFWMEFADFIKYFSEVCICRIINTSFFSLSKTWSESIHYGKWTNPDRAGGCANNKSTFISNPQYTFDIIGNDRMEETIINLDQRSLRYKGKDNLTIGFTIMKVEENRRYRMHSVQTRVATSTYINTRSVFMRLNLAPGRYCLVPTVFEPNTIGDFLLRIYTDNYHNFKELRENYPQPFLAACNPFAKYPQCVTQVQVLSATDLEPVKINENLSTYIIVICEGTSVQGKIFKNDNNPKWASGALFFRYKLNIPIKIQIWIHNRLKDILYGEIKLRAEPAKKKIRYECDPFMKNNETKKLEEKPGKVIIEIYSVTELNVI